MSDNITSMPVLSKTYTGLTLGGGKVKDTPTFLLFPKLPMEIRDAIWVFAAPAQRVLLITGTSYLDEHRHLGNAFAEPVAIKPVDNTTPAIFSVNRESRKAALELYTLTSSDNFQNPFYVNFDRDIICFVTYAALRAFLTSASMSGSPSLFHFRVQHMIIGCFFDDFNFSGGRTRGLEKFPNLKTLTIVAEWYEENDVLFMDFTTFKKNLRKGWATFRRQPGKKDARVTLMHPLRMASLLNEIHPKTIAPLLLQQPVVSRLSLLDLHYQIFDDGFRRLLADIFLIGFLGLAAVYGVFFLLAWALAARRADVVEKAVAIF
ncbi:hypothetical protein LZ554_000184 [Drepanopeziza brunnea f. sp. 'monogermtubi']|nr:hypothetical protein LZ554_000184 [Drepanopeziza brunnea f. sp. 'monogermtubi']